MSNLPEDLKSAICDLRCDLVYHNFLKLTKLRCYNSTMKIGELPPIQSEVKIQGDNYQLAGTLFVPQNIVKPAPAIIFYHGMVSKSKPRGTRRAEKLAEKGFIVLTFDFRGCGESEGKLGELSIANWLSDALLAFDFLSKQEGVDTQRVGVNGKSFGGYIGSRVVGERDVKSIVIQAPGMYKDEWEDNIYQWNDDFKKMRLDYRLSDDALKNKAADAIEKFRNPLLVIGSEFDDLCPKKLLEGYFEKAGSKNKKIAWIKGADHPLTRPEWDDEYIALMIDWFEQTL
jgi:uncharacterized protein